MSCTIGPSETKEKQAKTKGKHSEFREFSVFHFFRFWRCSDFSSFLSKKENLPKHKGKGRSKGKSALEPSCSPC